MPSKPVKSMRSLQDEFANGMEVNLIGLNQQDYEKPVVLDAVEATLYEIAEEFIKIAVKNLEGSDRVSTGFLANSIVPTDIEINGSIYTVNINIAKYYDFVNQGVKGWQVAGFSSPYQFKPPNKGIGKKNSKMVSAIEEWVKREGLQLRAKEIGHSTSKKRDSLRKNRKSVEMDTTRQTAIVISAQIRRRGLKPTHFLTKAEAAIVKVVNDKFGTALKVDIIKNLCR